MSESLPEVSQETVSFSTGLSIRDIVFTLYRRKWIILAIAIPIILVGGLSLMRQTGSYTAAARTVVELNEVEAPRWNTKTGNIDYDRELSTLFNIAMSVPVVKNAAKALSDSIPVIMELNPKLVSLDQPDELAGFLFDKMDVSVVGESSILEFQFSSVSPRIALMAVGALRDAFINYYTYERQDDTAVEYYKDQIDLVRAEMDSFLVERTIAMEEAGYSSLTDELRYNVGQLTNLEDDLFDVMTKTQSLEIEYNRLLGFLDKDPRDFPMGQNENRSNTLVNWHRIVSKHEDELNSLMSIHTPSSIPVKRQKELLDLSLKSLAQHQQNYVESFHLQLLKARAEGESLQAIIATLKEKNRRGPVAYQKISLLDSEIVSLRELLQSLQGKRGEVRLSVMADERVSKLVNLSDPEIKEIISGGKTVIYLGLLIVFAFALGLVAAFLMDTMDHRVFAPDDIEENLKLPVFASITRTE